VRKFNRQDNSLFQRSLGAFETRNVVPLDVRLLGYDRLRERTAQLLQFGVGRVVSKGKKREPQAARLAR
jgi:predicted GNAT family N-acyltransferase